MATDMGKLQKRKNIIKPIIWKKRCNKKHFKGIHDRTFQDPDFRKAIHEHYRDEDVPLLQNKILTESEYFRHKQNWWISLN